MSKYIRVPKLNQMRRFNSWWYRTVRTRELHTTSRHCCRKWEERSYRGDCMYVWSAHSREYGWTRYGCHFWSWSDNTGKLCFPCPRSRLRNWFCGTSRPSRPASARSFSTLRLNLELTHEIPAAFHVAIHIYTVNRYWVSPKFIGSRYCMPMAFTTRSPMAQCL